MNNATSKIKTEVETLNAQRVDYDLDDFTEKAPEDYLDVKLAEERARSQTLLILYRFALRYNREPNATELEAIRDCSDLDYTVDEKLDYVATVAK